MMAESAAQMPVVAETIRQTAAVGRAAALNWKPGLSHAAALQLVGRQIAEKLADAAQMQQQMMQAHRL